MGKLSPMVFLPRKWFPTTGYNTTEICFLPEAPKVIGSVLPKPGGNLSQGTTETLQHIGERNKKVKMNKCPKITELYYITTALCKFVMTFLWDMLWNRTISLSQKLCRMRVVTSYFEPSKSSRSPYSTPFRCSPKHLKAKGSFGGSPSPQS